jgi:hypothetical protein
MSVLHANIFLRCVVGSYLAHTNTYLATFDAARRNLNPNDTEIRFYCNTPDMNEKEVSHRAADS